MQRDTALFNNLTEMKRMHSLQLTLTLNDQNQKNLEHSNCTWLHLRYTTSSRSLLEHICLSKMRKCKKSKKCGKLLAMEMAMEMVSQIFLFIIFYIVETTLSDGGQ